MRQGDGAAPPLVIGWKEYVSFPEWGVRRVKAKVDTGARTSVLDVAGYDLFETPAGLVAELRLRLCRRDPERVAVVRAPVLRMVVVRNSGGVPERRPLVEAAVKVGPVTRRIPLTVTCRRGMCFRMLLGRKALEGAFVVDVSRKYLLRGRKRAEGQQPRTGG
jgi:hypothetical protein